MKKKTLITLPLLGLVSLFALPACTNANADNASSNPYLAHFNPKLTQPLPANETPKTDIPYQEDAANWQEFVNFLIENAKLQGFDARVIAQLKTLTFNPRVVKADQAQYERITKNRQNQASAEPSEPKPPQEATLMQRYLDMHISAAKVNRAVALLKNYQPILEKISAKYQVPMQVIVGLWGMESNFGKTQGSYNLLDSLASLAYEGRRREYFTREFFNALRVMEINGFSKEEMNSSWAGAVGQIQFMPTSYLVYGADGNDDGVVNIWLSAIDSFASIANYLHQEGWNPQLPWGIKVKMSFAQYLDKYKDLVGISGQGRTLAQWQALGLEINDQLQGIKADTPLWLVVPTNEPKQAYLVTKNYRVYMHWNRSSYFAYANGIFAQMIFEQLEKD
ncbi:lytic murein transglycosylase [Psittacicella gerlachiana]|nr:lytic murein transglycosylase [Psittacicella gerlachiana]